MGGRPEIPSYEALRQEFEQSGQGHVFRFWECLGEPERQALLEQAARIDLPSLQRAQAEISRRSDAGHARLEPIEVRQLPEFGGDPQAIERARSRGEELLRSGRVALLVVAGGQATRLGYDAPKGLYPIGPVSQRSLFEIQAQKLRRLRARYEQPIPWYVMTSGATDAPTREFFAAHGHFGLPAEDVFFFQQGMVASVDFEGRLMLSEPGRIFENPNGHGGSLTALRDSGALEDLQRRGVEVIFYYQVDNPLLHLADPAFLGFHALEGAEVSVKVIRKRDAEEKVGVLALADGRPGVVEYTEIDDAHRTATDPQTGQLLYWAGNTAVHAFDVGFVERVSARADELLPYHASAKKIPTVDANGEIVKPDAPNGHKFERFVFDALPAAKRVCLVEARRSDEYSPVKNATGVDSPETARQDLVRVYRSWLEAAGVEVPDGAVEIDHSRIDGPEDLRDLGIQRWDAAGDAILTEAGASA